VSTEPRRLITVDWERIERWVRRNGIFNNWLQKLGALLIALALWFVATSERRTTVTRTIEVPFEVRGVTKDRVVQGAPKIIKVRIVGARTDLEALKASDLEAIVDVSDLSSGFFSRDIEVNVPSNIRIAELEPRRISATLAVVVREPVTVRIATTPGSNLPRRAPRTVTAIGTTQQIAQVAHALGVTGGLETDLTPVDARGKLVEGVRLEPERVALKY
jgi:hypothetical protein